MGEGAAIGVRGYGWVGTRDGFILGLENGRYTMRFLEMGFKVWGERNIITLIEYSPYLFFSSDLKFFFFFIYRFLTCYAYFCIVAFVNSGFERSRITLCHICLNLKLNETKTFMISGKVENNNLGVYL